MKFNEQEGASWIASNLQSMYVDKKVEAIEKSTELGLTLEQFAASQICRDLCASNTLTFESNAEDDGTLESYIFNITDLMYIRDAEKYRAVAAEKNEPFEITVARAMARVLAKWVADRS
ncbi:MAG: hypothetical protein ABL888_16135 [Pirellulaceae bacterium]